ncbi:hypothetical protein [Roseovarius sp. M141]|uniref:hypothetical protein n=1 Tax=Roseovarius sp. M141 TaxID=2583806 RepID=UPI0020CEC1EE|nr:hypothetical protein [Roseovarius sp. M141]MCQ0092541.1 hypothetical protein [Roseovarius sp. M141]
MTETMTPIPATAETQTLAKFYAADSAGFSALEPDPALKKALEEDAGRMGSGLIEALTFAAALAVLYEALDVALLDILKSGWQTMAELQAYRDPQKHPPEEKSWVKLGRHKITSAHEPKVEVFFNGKRLGQLDFDAKLTLNVTDARLQVQGGRIWVVTGPVFEGEASLSYKGFALLKKKAERFTFPSGVTFEDGVPIIPMPVSVS